MLFRSEPYWEVIEPLKDMGWRLRRNFFLVKPKDQQKVKQVLAWVRNRYTDYPVTTLHCNYGDEE